MNDIHEVDKELFLKLDEGEKEDTIRNCIKEQSD